MFGIFGPDPKPREKQDILLLNEDCLEQVGKYLSGQDRWNFVKAFPELDLWNRLYISKKDYENMGLRKRWKLRETKDVYPAKVTPVTCWKESSHGSARSRPGSYLDRDGKIHWERRVTYQTMSDLFDNRILDSMDYTHRIAPTIDKMITRHMQLFYFSRGKKVPDASKVNGKNIKRKFYLCFEVGVFCLCGNVVLDDKAHFCSIWFNSSPEENGYLTAQAFIAKYEISVMATLECILHPNWFLPFSEAAGKAIDPQEEREMQKLLNRHFVVNSQKFKENLCKLMKRVFD